MFHDDVQTQFTHNWKRNINEHPIDRMLSTYFNPNNQTRNPQSNNYKSETKHIIQRQRVIRSFLNKPDEIEPSIRKSTTLDVKPKSLSITGISSPHLLFAELNEQSTNNNNRQQTIKKELERQSPILIRRYRPTIENLPSVQQMSDITNVAGNQSSINLPPHFTFRNKSSRAFLSDRSSLKINDRVSTPQIKSINYSKTISEGTNKQNTFNSKISHQNNSLPTHVWTPILSEQGAFHTKTLTGLLRTKSHLSRHFLNRNRRQLQNADSKNYIQDLHISPRTLNHARNELEMTKKIYKKELSVDEWEDPKSSNGGLSDEEESASADGNSSTSTCVSQISAQQYDYSSSVRLLPDQYQSSSPSSSSTDNSKSKIQRSPAKRSTSWRRAYNLALPPLAEHVDDEETDMKKILKKIYALHNNDFNRKRIELSVDDEDSLTFQLLNQQETEFEKNLSKSRKF